MTWQASKPATNEKIGDISGIITGNWEAIENAWNGDHETLTGDGTSSTNHDKVSLVAQAAATPAASVGILYCDSGNSNDLYYAYPTGGSYSTARVTQGGSTPGGADVFCMFNGTSSTPITPGNSYGVHGTSLVTKVGTGHYKVNFATAFSDANYTAIIQPSYTGSTNLWYTIKSVVKNASYLEFTIHSFYLYLKGGSDYYVRTSGATDVADINVVAYRNG